MRAGSRTRGDVPWRGGAAIGGRPRRHGTSAIGRRLGAAATALALLAWAAVPALAREITIESFDADIAVHPDARIEVVEQIRFRFTGSWNGVIRDIPVEYRTPQGMGYHLDLDVLGITDDANNALRWQSRRVRHYRELKIWVPGAEDAVATVVLHYRVANALRFFDEHDELYWNVTGDEWEMPIESATARVRLPANATGVRAVVFTGPYGSREQQADLEIGDAAATARLGRPLAFREGMSVVVGWDKGAVRKPSPLAQSGWFLRANWPLLFPLLALGIMFQVWRRVGRDPEEQPISVQYEPPKDLTPAEAGALIDHSLDMRDVTGTLVDLAVRGFLRIEERENQGVLGLFGSTDYVFHRTRPVEDWPTLKPHEREVLKGLFEDGKSEVALGELKNRFYRYLSPMRDRVFESLQERGFYRHRPDAMRRGFTVAGFLIAVMSVHAGVFAAALLGVPPVTMGLAVALTGIALIVFGQFMPARTLSGARTNEAVRGFQEFLGRVEAERIERVVRTPEMFERFLPYAMAFGVADRWAQAFRDICTEPPRWYGATSSRPFNFMMFSHSLDHLTSHASSTLSSSPRSSGGSGFGGGGSSGGGFGGGGGRGF